MTQADSSNRGLQQPLLRRITAHQLQLVDYALAVLLVALSLLRDFTGTSLQHHGVPSIAIWSSAALGIVVRRRWPVVSLGVLTAAALVAVLIHQASSAEPFIAFPMYEVASHFERRRTIGALVGVCSIVLVSNLWVTLSRAKSDFNATALVVGIAAWFVGDSVRVRRAYLDGLAEQAQQRQREILERSQRSVAEERLLIARELHDVVAHSLSVIAVQSGVGRHVIDEHPTQAKKALAAVEVTSRNALIELRRMLGVLRQDDKQPASLVPAPGVGSLDPLVDQVRTAGIEVELKVRSVLTESLSPALNLTIYRIVQEALTNVVKHAGQASVVVDLRDEPDALVVEVVDDGGGGLPAYPVIADEYIVHHGIVGMRERVALFDGEFLAAPRPEGGFVVRARFALESLGLK